MQKTAAVEALVQSVWALIGSNKLPGIADDAVAFLLSLLRFTSSDWTSAAGITIIALCLYCHTIRLLQIFILCS